MLLVLLITRLLFPVSDGDQSVVDSAVVARVIDGDTVELEDGSLVTGESSAVTLWIQGSAEDDAAPICPEGVNGCRDMRAPQGSILNRPRTNARGVRDLQTRNLLHVDTIEGASPFSV